MAKYHDNEFGVVFQALVNPTRRNILERLSTRPSMATSLAKQYDISFPTVSKHLKVLERAHLIRRGRLGRHHVFSIDIVRLRRALSWIEKTVRPQFNRLRLQTGRK